MELLNFITQNASHIKSLVLLQNLRLRRRLLSENLIGLQIGSQRNKLENWLNTDINTIFNDGIFYLNATKKFPFGNDTFGFVYSEHVIEHLNYEEGFSMISESYRVLKPGGVIRIATPNLNFLINLILNPVVNLNMLYIEKFYSTKTKKSIYPNFNNPVPVLNNFVRDWGHKFIYDSITLKELLLKVGFTKIVNGSVGESEHSILCNLESHGNLIGDTENRLETMVIEASK